MEKSRMKNQRNFRVNEEITGHKTVRIVGENIETNVVSLEDALNIAKKMNLDAIEINRVASPPIVKIANYEKMVYEMNKNSKKNKNTTTVKEIQLSATISEHDLAIKAKKAAELLKKGHKIKVILTLKGREMCRQEENQKPIYQFIVLLEDVASLENQIKTDGNKTIVFLKSK